MAVATKGNAGEILATTMLARGMGEAELQELLNSGSVKIGNYKKGDIVFHDGDMPRALYILLAGEVHILKDSFSGRQIFLSEINHIGDMFGEVYEVLKMPYDIYVQAVSPTKLLEVSSRLFTVDTSESPSRSALLVQRNLLHIFARKAYGLSSKVRVLASGSLREKLVRFLMPAVDENGVVTLAVSREYIAAYLAVSRPSLSRELGIMQREGLIKVAGKRITVVDMERFESYL